MSSSANTTTLWRGAPGISQFGAFGSRLWNAQKALAASQLVSAVVISDSLGVGWTSDIDAVRGSLTWWDISYIRKTIAALQAVYGNGGSGFVPVAYAATLHNGLVTGPYASITGSWTDQFSESAPNGHGIQPTVSGNGATITFPSIMGRYVQIITRQKSGFGTVTYNIDSGAFTGTINLNAAEAINTTVIDTAGAGPHTITLTAATGQSRIYGVRGVNATGLVVDNFCLDGRAANDLNVMDAVQSLVINATGGTFTVTVENQTTAAIAWNATTAAVKAALETLPNVQKNDVAVTGAASAYQLRWVGTWKGQPIVPTASGASLTGGAGTATVTTQVDYIAAGAPPGGVGGQGGGLVESLKVAAVSPTGTANTTFPALLINCLGENALVAQDTYQPVQRGALLAPYNMVMYGDAAISYGGAPAKAPDHLLCTPSFTGFAFSTPNVGNVKTASMDAAIASQGAWIDFDGHPSLAGNGSPLFNLHIPITAHTAWAAVLSAFLINS